MTIKNAHLGDSECRGEELKGGHKGRVGQISLEIKKLIKALKAGLK
jgi:hypothetical protein